MSKKRFLKVFLYLVSALTAVVIFLIAIAFFVAWIAWRSGAPLPL